jgi:hypothetical protein
MIGCRVLTVAALASCLLGGLTSPVSAGGPPGSVPAGPVNKEAGKHFQRGVALFGEADYRAALVEFRRAYELAPNAAVLYNLGQTHYQLQNYAAALIAFERYLTEAPGTAAHRHEVEQTIEILRARVGKVMVTTDVADCEITIDDELVGKTPLGDPILVSLGRRKITAIHAGRTPDTRFIDVAAGDTVQVALSLPDPAGRPGAGAASGGSLHARDLITPGWIATGVLGAGALTVGTLAFFASRDLHDARTSFPTSRGDLDQKSAHVVTLSAVADILAAATLITGGITLTLRWSQTRSREVHVAVTPHAILLSGSLP